MSRMLGGCDRCRIGGGEAVQIPSLGKVGQSMCFDADDPQVGGFGESGCESGCVDVCPKHCVIASDFASLELLPS